MERKEKRKKIMIHITSNSIDILSHLPWKHFIEKKNNKFFEGFGLKAANKEEKYWINMIEI